MLQRAFIQFAGFTFGMSQSFYDFYVARRRCSHSAATYRGLDTGDSGQFVMGYTAQFGNGLSGSIAAEAATQPQHVCLEYEYSVSLLRTLPIL